MIRLSPKQLHEAIIAWLTCIYRFSQVVTQVPLRTYQIEASRAILDSVLHNQGLSFAVMMARQAGKNELSAQIEAYLLNLYQQVGGGIVKASPTFKPQTINSILRLLDRLNNPWNEGQARRREGYIVELGRARCFFFSADKNASVVGGTADLLLECDEAQDIREDKWDKDFEPMTASTNATRVFYGTAWTSDTLLAKTIAHLEELQRADGQRRVFIFDADRVSDEVPAYRKHVDGRVAKLGRQHPLIRTQYFLETIDGSGGLFNIQRRALMRGSHERQHSPQPSHVYVLLVDVGGEDEAEGNALERSMLENPKRDATCATVVDVVLRPDALPLYLVIDRTLWIGVKHTTLHGQIVGLVEHWSPIWILIDATGIGAGLASFLAKRLGEKVQPIIFSPKLKSDLGWAFIGVVETGRFKDYQDDTDAATRQFWYEVSHCEYRIRPGPGKSISWGVWQAPAYDGLIAQGHDDCLISAAMCALLDDYTWPLTGDSGTVRLPDTLSEIDKGEW